MVALSFLGVALVLPHSTKMQISYYWQRFAREPLLAAIGN